MYNRILKMDDIPKNFFDVGERKMFKKNEVIIHEGKIMDDMYILVKGKILVFSNSKDGLICSKLILVPLCIIGEVSVITQKHITSSFMCMENSEVITINRNTLLNLMKNDFNINNFLYEITAKKFYKKSSHLLEYTTLSSEERIILFLVELAETFGVKTDNKIKIDFHISQQFISNFASVERTTTVRALNKLKDNNILDYHDGYYYINNLDLLKKNYKNIIKF